jgi:hypothetical protein
MAEAKDGGEKGKKKFNQVEIIVAVMIAFGSDLLLLAVDIITPIPIVGWAAAVVIRVIELLLWFSMQTWFFMKMGFFGRIGVMQAAGGIVSVIGIPFVRTGTVISSIYMANHPKTLAVVQLAEGNLGAAKAELSEAESLAKAGAAEARGGARVASEREAEALSVERSGSVPRPPRPAEEASGAPRPSEEPRREGSLAAGEDSAQGAELAEEFDKTGVDRLRESMENLPDWQAGDKGGAAGEDAEAEDDEDNGRA